MKHLIFPLSTASAFVAIARPAMASSGATIATLEHTGLILGLVGIGLMCLQYLLVKFNLELDPEEKLKKMAFSISLQSWTISARWRHCYTACLDCE
jgi:hypothetical protein